MKIAVWTTGHEIADTVAESLVSGFNGYDLDFRYYQMPFLPDGYDAHMGYGILRGMGEVMKACENDNLPFFHLDRGYFGPGHYGGYYRISYKGTQAKYDPEFPVTKEFEGKLEPWRKDDKSKPILICPPTNHVMAFFGMPGWNSHCFGNDYVIRTKGDPNPINWDDYRAVITFNSSVGWQALQRGIPCLSDATHSVVGSYYGVTQIDKLIEMIKHQPRKPLFDFMSSHQFTLDEIRRGLAWPLIKYYLSRSTLAGTQEKPLQQMSALTASQGALKSRFQSTI